MSEEASTDEREETGVGSIQDGIFNLVIALYMDVSKKLGKQEASRYVIDYLSSLVQGLSSTDEQQESE